MREDEISNEDKALIGKRYYKIIDHQLREVKLIDVGVCNMFYFRVIGNTDTFSMHKSKLHELRESKKEAVENILEFLNDTIKWYKISVKRYKNELESMNKEVNNGL